MFLIRIVETSPMTFASRHWCNNYAFEAYIVLEMLSHTGAKLGIHFLISTILRCCLWEKLQKHGFGIPGIFSACCFVMRGSKDWSPPWKCGHCLWTAKSLCWQLNREMEMLDVQTKKKFAFASLSPRYGMCLRALQDWVDKENIFKIAEVISKLFISNRKLQDDI